MHHMTPLVTLAAVAALALNGCRDDTEPAPADPQPANAAADHAPDHDQGDDHDHGQARSLGTLTIGDATLEVSVSGTTDPGAELHLDIVHTSGPRPSALRFWIGSESGVGSLRSKADAHDDHFHGHVEVPAAPPEDAALWIEAETASGQRILASIDLH